MAGTIRSQLFVSMWSMALVLIVVSTFLTLKLIDRVVQRDLEQTMEASLMGFERYNAMERNLLERAVAFVSSMPWLKATLDIEGVDQETSNYAAVQVKELVGAGWS